MTMIGFQCCSTDCGVFMFKSFLDETTGALFFFVPTKRFNYCSLDNWALGLKKLGDTVNIFRVTTDFDRARPNSGVSDSSIAISSKETSTTGADI